MELENVTFWQPFSGKGVCHVDSCIREDGTDFHHGSVVVFIYCAIEFSVVNVVFSILKRLLHYISPMKERLS